MHVVLLIAQQILSDQRMVWIDYILTLPVSHDTCIIIIIACEHYCNCKAVDKGVLGGARAPPPPPKFF